MALCLPFSFSYDFRDRIEHGDGRAADIIEERFGRDILIFREDERQADNGIRIHAKAGKDDVGSAERCELRGCHAILGCPPFACRKDALLHRIPRIALEQRIDGIAILPGIVAPDERLDALTCSVLRLRDIVDAGDADAVCAEHRNAGCSFRDSRSQPLPDFRARIRAAVFRCMEENLHLTADGLTVVVNHRMQEIAEAVFVVAQLFEKLLLLFENRFSRNHERSPSFFPFMIRGCKDGEMLDFFKTSWVDCPFSVVAVP